MKKLRMQKNLLSLLLSGSLVLALALITAPTSMAASFEATREMVAMSNGHGSNGRFLAPIDAPDPNAIKIYTAQDLSNVRNNLSGSYVLMNDIDLSGFNGGEWMPIGVDSGSGFSGVFDGQGFVIHNMKIIAGHYSYAGLFGDAYDAAIKNVGLESIDIIDFQGSMTTGYHLQAGSICGYLSGSSISNCYNTGNVTAVPYSGGSAVVGGICGYSISSSTISNCYNTGDVSSVSSSANYTGGICGLNNSSTISNCYNSGYVSSSYMSYTSEAFTGGICGDSQSGATISNCYNSGDVSAVSNETVTYPTDNASARAGGICGLNINSTISNCYSTGDVSAYSNYTTLAHTGGICGYSYYQPASIVLSPAIVSNSYWRLESNQFVDGTSRTNAEKRCIGNEADTATGRLADAQMRSAESFVGFDFNAVWDISSATNSGYPFLRGTSLNPLGDLNGDGAIDIGDVNLLYLNVRGRVTLTQSQLAIADVNNDGKVDIADVNLLYLYVRGRVSALG